VIPAATPSATPPATPSGSAAPPGSAASRRAAGRGGPAGSATRRATARSAGAATPAALRAAGLAPRRLALDLGAVALMLGVSVAGFWPTFAGPSYLAAAVGGLAIGLSVAAVAAWRRVGLLVVAGLTIAVYFVFGGALALPQTCALGFVPTLATLQQLAVGAVTSWKALVTTVAPVSASDGFLLVPFLLLLLGGVIAGSLALRLRRPAWAVLPIALVLVVQIVFGMPQPAVPVLQGIVLAVVAIGWLAVRQAWAPVDEQVMVSEGLAAGGTGLRRAIAGAAVLAIAGGAGVAVAAIAQPTAPRQVLRQVVVPPFDVRQYPSPLQSYRQYVRDDRTTALFTVTGLPKGARVALATMDAYTGVVYDVASGGGASGSFAPLQSNMSPGAAGTPATVTVRIRALTGVWLPTVGATKAIAFTGAHADALRRSGNENAATGTAVVTAGLAKGDAYTLDAVVPAQPSDARLKSATFAPITLPKVPNLPPEIASKAADIVSKATTPATQVRALQKYLASNGYFSHGLPGEVTSLSGHGAERIQTLVDAQQMVGDDEQYAVAMTLMARSLGIPARVVMGFHPSAASTARTFTATGDTLHAWVEVDYRGFGWVAYDPTPPKDRVATEQQPKPKPQPKPQVPQPPPPVQRPLDGAATTQKDKGQNTRQDDALGILLAVLGYGGAAVGGLAILAAPFLVIGALKATRRRARRGAERPTDRISGGWDELMDRAADYGARTRPGATRVEDAAAVAVAVADPAVATLAHRADGEVFGPAEPTDDEVEAFWADVDGIVSGMNGRATFWRRLRARVSVYSLLGRTRFARGVRGASEALSDRAKAARDELGRQRAARSEERVARRKGDGA
jgi:transglutaminase-like putative cysteine protease